MSAVFSGYIFLKCFHLSNTLMFLTRSHTSQAFSYLSQISHTSHISHIFLHLSCILITHSRSYNLSCSHFVISHAPLYFIRFTLSRISYTSSHFSRTLIFPSRSYIRSLLFLAPLTCSKLAILKAEKMLSTEATCITDPNIVTIHSG